MRFIRNNAIVVFPYPISRENFPALLKLGNRKRGHFRLHSSRLLLGCAKLVFLVALKICYYAEIQANAEGSDVAAWRWRHERQW